MPTGYTSIIDENEDVTFKQFASKCAYAFGAQYHTAAIEKEEKGAKEADEWVRLLREAL